ncbi:MAG TPA: FAD-dependent oxidoreductase [Thermomicrobiales bacterium]|nr:FAD-dependent oxidoreductase [Thermomicrobiales bacterium]
MLPRPDVLIVGGGLAGLAAAGAAARAGASTIVLDDQASRGIDPRHWLRNSALAHDGATATELTADAVAAGAVVRSDTSVWGCFPDLTVTVTDLSSTFSLHPKRVIVATGAHDLPVHFPGSSLLGVITASELLQESLDDGSKPGRRHALLGSPEDVGMIAMAIRRAGGEIVAHARLGDDVRAEGAARVEAFWTAESRHPCEVIVVAVRQAANELARMAGCRVIYHPHGGGFIAVLDAHRQGTVSGIFVAGDAAGPCAREVAIAEGDLAGLAAATSIGIGDPREVDQARTRLVTLAPGRLVASLVEPGISRSIDDATIICRCENVRADQIREAISYGAGSIDDVKRRTRAGMGLCQGVECMAPIADLLHEDGQIPYTAIAPMTARPPIRSISLGQLGALDQKSANVSHADEVLPQTDGHP